MKKCKVYSSKKKVKAEAVIFNGRILLPAPRRDDLEPVLISDGQCYYPPLYATAFAQDMYFDLMPFSTACEWGEYNNGEDSKVRRWYQNLSGNDGYDVKCGYCDTKTGEIRIPPEMGYCGDFNAYGAAIFGEAVDYSVYLEVSPETAEKWIRLRDGVYSGLINTSGEIISLEAYVGIEETHYGAFFVYRTADGWGVTDSKGNYLIEPLFDELSWDGLGGFTVASTKADGRLTYGIINPDGDSYLFAEGLTNEPKTVYNFPAEKRRESLSLSEHFHTERFRLTQRNDKYGLLRDVLQNTYEPLETYSEEVLEPIYEYSELPDAAYNTWVEAEIKYYAKVLEKTPRILPGRIGDGWDAVPEDIRKAVHNYMETHDMIQPERL